MKIFYENFNSEIILHPFPHSQYKLYSNEIVIKMSSGFEFNINRTSGVRKANNLSGTGVLCKPLQKGNMSQIFKRIKDLRYKKFKENQKF